MADTKVYEGGIPTPGFKPGLSISNEAETKGVLANQMQRVQPLLERLEKLNRRRMTNQHQMHFSQMQDTGLLWK
jgi:hypothetical protein